MVNPLVEEAEATLLAIARAKDSNLSNLIFARDSSLVIDCLCEAPLSPVIPWKIRSIVLNSLALPCSFPCWSFVKIP